MLLISDFKKNKTTLTKDTTCSYQCISNHSSKLDSIAIFIVLSEVTSENGINQFASILIKRYQVLLG